MNDRFKFRVWDKKSNNYIKDFVFNFINKVPYITIEYFDNEYEYTHTFEEDEIIPEQCTGLRDKNGKLIYENDLIKCPTGIYRIAVDDFGLWTVIYNNNPFEGVGEWGDVVKEYAFNQNNVEIEVLGNIHENADLLEIEE